MKHPRRLEITGKGLLVKLANYFRACIDPTELSFGIKMNLKLFYAHLKVDYFLNKILKYELAAQL